MRSPADAAAHRPRVLVLMATFNGARWLPDQLQSIFAQHEVDLTLVIRDDASSDDTVRIARAACEGRVGTTILSAHIPGGSAAANFFALMINADVSGHDFVALADQDDIWEPEKLARAAECLREHDALGYSAAVTAFWPDGRTAVLRQNTTQTHADYLFEGMGQGCTFVMRSGFFSRVQGTLRSQRALLPRLHYHDWTLYALCRLEGGRWIHDERISMRYRQHAANDTGARSGMAGVRMRLAKIRDHWYGGQVDAMARLCVAVRGDAAGPARVYLQFCEAANLQSTKRFALCRFVWKNGRRRFTDRLIVGWAALCGYLAP